MSFERFVVELREAFANANGSAVNCWQEVARRALSLALLVEPQPPPPEPSKKKR